MIHRLRLAALAAFLPALSGCNNVVSMEPWFTVADARGAPRLRQGLWIGLSDADCRVNTEKPAERWPDCAGAYFVRGGEWMTMRWDDPDGPGGRRRVFERWSNDSVLLAAGDPVIFQVEMDPGPPAEPDPDAVVLESDEPDWRYNYAAMRPTEFDNLGRVVAFEIWSVQCGPLERVFEGGVEYSLEELTEGNATEQPFPGLTVVGDHCIAESTDAIRGAAVLSRTLGAPTTMRWVRVGWR